MIDFMKTAFPKNTPAPLAPKKVTGLFLGWFVQPGGIWSGDYIVVEYAPFQTNPEMSYGKMRKIAHRIREVDNRLTADGKFKFPLGERKDALARHPPGAFAKRWPQCHRRYPG
jgi:hypothetical protein